MLQQGTFVADVIYYYGEDSNVTALYGDAPPEVPAGYGYDFANSDVLLNRLSVANGRLTTPTGLSYRLLALDPNSQRMPLPVLRRIRDLVNAGAIVVGPAILLLQRPGGGICGCSPSMPISRLTTRGARQNWF